jgi:hypothetical protein
MSMRFLQGKRMQRVKRKLDISVVVATRHAAYIGTNAAVKRKWAIKRKRKAPDDESQALCIKKVEVVGAGYY